MREILFRGKRTDNGEWGYGYYLNRSNDKEDIHCIMEKYPITTSKRVIPETVGQYTGLTDKNGTKIFEGDIVKHIRTLWGADNSDIGTIMWCENTCKFYRTSKFDTLEKVELWKDTAENYEIIGNIHDNPELLESEVQGE